MSPGAVLRMLAVAAACVWSSPVAVSTTTAAGATADPDVRELRIEPTDLATRDFFNEPWGAEQAPLPDVVYTYVAPKNGGINPGMTVRDPTRPGVEGEAAAQHGPERRRADRGRAVPGVVGIVEFHDTGRHQSLVDGRIRPGDVRWAAELLARISDGQRHDAFRVGGYAPAIRQRFINTLKSKINDGLRLQYSKRSRSCSATR